MKNSICQDLLLTRLDTALKNLVTLDNTDAKVRLQHYIDFNKYFVTDQAVVIPMFSATDKAFVNNRVKKWSLELPQGRKHHLDYLT